MSYNIENKKAESACPVCGRERVYDYAINPYYCKALGCPANPITEERFKEGKLDLLTRYLK